jgi:hypothetical protein
MSRGSRSGPASALSDLVDHEGEPDANHPGVLGQGDTLLSGTHGTLLSHAGGPQVQAHRAQGKGGQPSAGQPGRHHRQHQGRADGDLRRGQQSSEPFGIELAKERIGSRGKAMELACGGVVGAALGQPRVEEVRQ